MPSVCAVVASAALVANQERAPDAIAETPDVLGRVATVDGDWVWLVDGTALPDPGALRALLDAAARLEPLAPAALLASVVVGPGGGLAAEHAPQAPRGRAEVAMRTATLRVLHVRATTAGSVLVRREAVAAGPPVRGSGAAAGLAWTARLLAGEALGFLVPASTARAAGGVAGGRAYAHRVAALLRDGELSGPERLRLGAEVVERAFRPRSQAARSA